MPSQFGPGGVSSPSRMPVQFTTLYSESNIHHQPSVDSAVGMTHGKSTAPRIRRLPLRFRASNIASQTPSTIYAVRAIPVNTNEFCTVWRNTSLPTISLKLSRPMNLPGEPTQ